MAWALYWLGRDARARSDGRFRGLGDSRDGDGGKQHENAHGVSPVKPQNSDFSATFYSRKSTKSFVTATGFSSITQWPLSDTTPPLTFVAT